MFKQPLQLSPTDMLPLDIPYHYGDSAANRVKRLINKNTIVSDALARTNLRFSLVKYEKSLRRVA